MTRISKRLVASYILDWIIVIAIAAVGAGLWYVTPNKRPFTLTDPSISFPHSREKVSTGVLFVVSLVAPAVVIFFVVIIFIPGPSVPLGTPKSKLWKRKLWEINVGWLGLALSLALSFFFTQSMKNLFGKPRPDLLSRCDPDYENQDQYRLGGYPDVVNGFILVSATICRQTDEMFLNDGFSSFPSGHCSYSFGGLLYLALYLASKFSVSIPYLLPFSHSAGSTPHSAFRLKPPSNTSPPATTTPQNPSTPLRTQAAAPPLYLLLLPLIPTCAAIYVASTRYSDFRHHGFDILFGSLLGTFFAFMSFRLYHLPVRRGGGWSWGPRGVERAFGVGVGRSGWVSEKEGWVDGEGKKRDEEVGLGKDSGVGNGNGNGNGNGVLGGGMGGGRVGGERMASDRTMAGDGSGYAGMNYGEGASGVATAR